MEHSSRSAQRLCGGIERAGGGPALRAGDGARAAARRFGLAREKTQIQALDRTHPMRRARLPLRPGQVARRTHDYKRHGTTESVCEGHNGLQCRDRGGARTGHPSPSRYREFRQFLAQIQRATPPDVALHPIVDNSSTHYLTEAIRDFLAAHPRFHLHFTPTSASWLNAVETWFGQVERRALRRGVFTSVTELREEIRRFIEAHNMHAAKPFRWTKSARASVDASCTCRCRPILDAVERARKTLRTATAKVSKPPPRNTRTPPHPSPIGIANTLATVRPLACTRGSMSPCSTAAVTAAG